METKQFIIKAKEEHTCPQCRGEGITISGEICYKCKGKGSV